MKSIRALIVAGLAALTACGTDSTGPGGVLSGTIAFSFSGMTSGSFSAQGALTSSTNAPTNASWAAGYRDPQDRGVGVQGNSAQSGGIYHIASLTMSRVTVGTSEVASDCTGQQEFCTAFIVIFGNNDANDSFTFLCSLENGTLTITEISGTRVKGTFSGSGMCLDPQFSTGEFAVSGGTFDVPLVTDIPD